MTALTRGADEYGIALSVQYLPGMVCLDADDVVVDASRGEVESASEDSGPGETDSAAVGRSFSDLVADPQMAELYRLVFRRVRRTGKTIRIPFRHDSPTQRRHMEMDVVALEGGGLECRSRVFLVENRRRAEGSHPGARPAKEFLTLCSWCKKVRLPEGTWVEADAAAERLEFFLGETPELTHGICPPCKTALRERCAFAR